MIEVNELRVGNWVEMTGLKMQLTERKLYLLFSDIVERNGESFKVMRPILLTPELLEKCDKEQMRKIADLAYIATSTYGGFSFNIINHKEIEYVHQLQNFYFACTGEELEIQL
jgi:hypothetical protein